MTQLSSKRPVNNERRLRSPFRGFNLKIISQSCLHLL
ncbi:hypothetical protein [Escherichia phage CLB_P2]|nr:hypothetical protein [Escherichia phage CLB_P2]